MNVYSDEVVSEKVGAIGFITLNRPKALNALSLPMVRELTHVLRGFEVDASVLAVVIRGSNKEGPFGAFCAGGDIRYFHQAALSGDASLEDFFTEEYNLNHIIHTYSKPYIAFMDGIVMGGGMGLSQGIALRVVTERTQMAMPETQIGLFPDVGGGYFLSRCPGNTGEYLALTGQLLRGAESLAVGLADVCIDSQALTTVWDGLQTKQWKHGEDVVAWVKEQASSTSPSKPAWWDARIDTVFRLPTVRDIVDALSQLVNGEPEGWAAETLKALRHRSPLLLAVSLEQIRKDPAQVEVLNMKPVPLVVGEGKTAWVRVPQGLAKFQTQIFASIGRGNGVADYKVTHGGYLVVACNYDYQGNPSGNWTEDRWTREQFYANGWRELVPEEIGGPLVDGQGRQHVLFVRGVSAGQTGRLRCNKYSPPYFILCSDIPVTK